MHKPSFFKYAFLTVWFVLAPAALALLTAFLIARADVGGPTGAFGLVQSFVREQWIPALIIFFTLFEMTLYSFRHSLPLADRQSVGGRTGLSASVRRDIEFAAQLLDESERILDRRGAAVDQSVPAGARTELRDSLEALRKAMQTAPFDDRAFSAAYERAVETSHHLDPWRKGELREYVESIGIAVLVALLLRAVVIEAFKIPSGSMLPTLQIDDHIFVNKFIYGPTVPFTDIRLLERMPPKRGDVIVFEFPDPDPRAPRQDFIKRVIGLPGDTLEAEGGHPIINGFKVPNCRVGHYEFPSGGDGALRDSGDLYVEFLGEYAYLTLFEDGRSDGHQGPYRVKPGEIWVFGDNRNNSSDSRAWNNGAGGGVPFANIKGRAMFVWYPFSRLFVDVMGKPQLPKGTEADVIANVERCLQNRPPLSETTPPERG